MRWMLNDFFRGSCSAFKLSIFYPLARPAVQAAVFEFEPTSVTMVEDYGEAKMTEERKKKTNKKKEIRIKGFYDDERCRLFHD